LPWADRVDWKIVKGDEGEGEKSQDQEEKLMAMA
jgi:hypothetical protein